MGGFVAAFGVPRRGLSVVRRALLGAAAVLCMGAASARAEDVVVGAQFSLSGPAAAFAGPNLAAAAKIAVEHVNAAQMLGSGRTLKLVLDDNAGSKTQAISLVSTQATSDQVVAIVGPQNSGLALPAAPVANDLKVPILALGGSAAIAQSGPWSFTLLAPPDGQIVEPVKLVTDKLKAKAIGIVFDRANDSSVGIKNAFEAAMKAHGVQVVASEGVVSQDTNFGPLATKLANTDMDALYIEAPPTTVANLVIQARQAGLDPKVKIISSPNVATPQFVKVGGAAVDGVYYPTFYVASQATPENKLFVEAYRKQMGADPDSFAAMGYNGVMLVAAAIRTAGPGADRDHVRAALGDLHDVPSIMGTGLYSFGKDRLPRYTNVMVQIVSGKEQIVPLN